MSHRFDLLITASLGLICGLILFRNNWVFRNRVRMLSRDQDMYQRLESYSYMMFHFWQWDFKKFIRPESGVTYISVGFQGTPAGDEYLRKHRSERRK